MCSCRRASRPGGPGCALPVPAGLGGTCLPCLLGGVCCRAFSWGAVRVRDPGGCGSRHRQARTGRDVPLSQCLGSPGAACSAALAQNAVPDAEPCSLICTQGGKGAWVARARLVGTWCYSHPINQWPSSLVALCARYTETKTPIHPPQPLGPLPVHQDGMMGPLRRAGAGQGAPRAVCAAAGPQPEAPQGVEQRRPAGCAPCPGCLRAQHKLLPCGL